MTISPARRYFEHVADGDRFGAFGPALADVNQQRNFQFVAELARAFQRLQSLAAQRAAGGHDLDADDDIAVGFDGLLDLGFIDEPRVGENAIAGTADSAEGREVDVVQIPASWRWP